MDEIVDFETLEVKFKIIAVLHGGIERCDNSVYPAIYNRIAEKSMYQWILDKIPNISGKNLKQVI